MADVSHPGGWKGWLSNGGGTISWRIISTALAIILLGLVRYEAQEITTRLDRIDERLDTNAQATAALSSHVDVHAQRLDNEDRAQTSLWTAVHANATILNDHEHRLSLLEGARERR